MATRIRPSKHSTETSRRMFVGLLGFAPRLMAAGDPALAILVCSESDSSRQVLDAARESLERAGLAPEVFSVCERPVSARGWRLVVALGREAVAAALAAAPKCPVVSAMTSAAYAAASASERHTAAAVVLDVPATEFVAEVKAVLPGCERIGVMLNPTQPTSLGEGLIGLARKQAGVVHVVECPRPEQLLRAFLSLRGKVGVAVAVPDGALFNGATIKPLILASLENRLPIAGFSASFVRAGAAVGVYPDFRELGVQAAELALRLLRGESPVTVESPRKLTVAVNQRVGRLMGIEFGRPRRGEAVVFK